MTKLEDAKLKSILPSSISHDEKMRAAADSLQKWLTSIAKAGPDGQLWVDIDALSSLDLDHLAWQFRADVWRDTWPMSIKRATIRNIIEDKRLKGTRWAVERAVEHLGSSVEIVEWWQVEPKAPHNTFDVVIDLNEIPGQASTEVQRDLRAAIDKAKPARELYQLILALKTEGVLGLYGAHRSMAIFRIDGVGVETFDPLTLNPLVWLDPSDVATLFIDSAGTQPVQFSGDPVGLWKNKGTLGAVGDAAQPVSASRPVWADANDGAVVFDGLGSLMRTTYTPTLPQSVFMFARRTGPPPTGGANRIISTSIALPYIQILDTSVGISAGWSDGDRVRPAPNNNGRSNSIIGAEWSAGRFRSYIGDTVAANDALAPTNFTAAGPWAINTNGNLEYECGDVFIFDRILTDQERSQLIAWMEAQHGI